MPSSKKMLRARPAIAVAILALAIGAAPASAGASESAAACVVNDGTLTWGIKESFRAYISGTIAKGTWEATDGATYETPTFTFTGARGEFDATGSGEIAFDGSVLFTGHDGLLRTTFANPTIVFDQGEPRLLIDVSGVSMEDALAGSTDAVVTQTQVPLVALGIDADSLPLGESGEIIASDVTTTVTPEGYAAFSNYEEGSAMDPLSFSAQLECAAPVAEKPTPEASAIPLASDDNATSTTDLPAGVWLGIGAGALVVGGGVTAWGLRRRATSGPSAAGEVL